MAEDTQQPRLHVLGLFAVSRGHLQYKHYKQQQATAVLVIALQACA